MPSRPAASLLDEAGAWIAEQMSEEGIVVSEGFVELVQSMEWDLLEAGLDPEDRGGAVSQILARMAEERIMVGPMPEALATEGVAAPEPKPVPPHLVEQVLSWEDEFLGLAGISRRDPQPPSRDARGHGSG